MSYVEKILNHYLQVEKNKEKIGYDKLSQYDKDVFRLSNDKDANYYYNECHLKCDEALKADTIASFWTPYCCLLRQEAGWDIFYNAKTTKTLTALLNQIRRGNNKYTDKINRINEKIEKFAECYYTKGNYMLLPKRGMNNKRYELTEDRIDCTLYECFAKGSLSSFFDNEQVLLLWIKRERLESVFSNNIISKNNIDWFTNKNNMISQMGSTEIYEYLSKLIKLIEIRNR